MNYELQEKQRYGRNKDTVINHSFINSGEYRKKFDRISNDRELNRMIYQIAKKMLNHRSGTMLEDNYIFELFYRHTVAKYRKRLLSEFDAQICALEELQRTGDISFEEV